MSHEVFLDHFQTEQFGLYWRHYPQIGLNPGLFCNLLLYGNLGLESDDFYPDEVRRFSWSAAFDKFVSLGKMEFIHEKDAFDRAVNAVFSSNSDELCRLNVPDYADVFNYEYCVRQNIPFCLSRQRAQDFDRIISTANKVFNLPPLPEPIERLEKTRTSLAEWFFDIEIPALSVRNETMKKKYHNFQEAWFISPEELVEIFSDTKNIDAIRSNIALLAERVATRSELADTIKMEYDELNERVGISDWVFTGLGLALDWVPIPGTGTASTIAQLGINKLVHKKYGWLLFMNSINKRLRENPISNNKEI